MEIIQDSPVEKDGRAQVLVVDDEPEILLTMRRQFRSEFDVYTATDAQAALVILAERPIHVVISDQRMPGLSGCDFLARVMKAYPDTIRILLTGYSDIKSVIDAVNNGHIYNYVKKPWNASELRQIICDAYDKIWLLEHNRKLVAELRQVTDDLRIANLELALANEKAAERVSRAERLQADLAAVMDAVPMVVNIARDPECKTIVGNRFADTFFGVTPEANISLSAPDEEPTLYRVLRNGDEVAARDLPLQRAARGVEVRDWECDLVFRDGTVKALIGSASPLRGPDGAVCGSVGAFLDVTERKRLEADLRAQRERLQLFIDGAPAGIAMFDAEMRYIAVSQRFASDYGVAADDLVGRNHYDVFPEITDRWRDVHQRCLGGETIRCDEDPFPRADGRLDWVRWEIRPWHSEPNKIGGIILFAEKITGRKAVENDLQAAKISAERANDAKTRFLASVSHDLRQPLQAQRFLLFSTQRKATDPDQVRAFAQMEKTLDATETMLSRLMDFAALESGSVQVKRDVIRLDLVIRDIVHENDDEAERKGLAIGMRLIPCWTESDPVLLGRIVRNLITNAVRYTEKGGVLVGIRRRGANLRIEVRDTGKGIPPNKQRVIFEEFRQLDNPERNRTKGHGLGLAIVVKTAELLGHQLFLRSVPGRGSLFAVEVARTEEPERNVESPGMSIVSPAQALIVLVVEDDPVQAEAVAAVLTDCGYRVVVACDAAGAMAARPIPDLIISDYRLAGGLTGLGVVDCVRKANNKAIPALIMTGDTQAAIALDVARMGCYIIYKPCAPSLLMASIARAMTAGNG